MFFDGSWVNVPCFVPIYPDNYPEVGFVFDRKTLGNTMPSKKFKGYEKAATRWVKMIRGKRHYITCEQLGLPKEDWTEGRSMEKAKAWYAALLNAEQAKQIEPEAKKLVDELVTKIQYAKTNKPNEVAALEATKATIEKEHWSTDGFTTDPGLAKKIEGLKLLGFTIPDGIDEQLLSQIFGSGAMWNDRLSSMKEVETSFTLSHQIAKWLEIEKGRGIEHKTYLEYVTRSKDILSTLGETFDVRTIEPKTVQLMYSFYKTATIQKKSTGFRIFKRFVRHLAEEEITALPGNLDSKKFTFPKIPLSAIQKYDDATVLATLENLTERNRLYALLALNCSMTNKDIANLSKHRTYTDEQDKKEYASLGYLDLKAGTITRSREKNKNKNPPTVTYKLWPTTLKLLKKLQSKHERWVLTSSVNTKLVGDGNTTDMISKQWEDKTNGIDLIDFRSITATAVGSVPLYKPYVTAWLCNKPQTISEKHYDAGTQSTMDEISDYVGKKFKQNNPS